VREELTARLKGLGLDDKVIVGALEKMLADQGIAGSYDLGMIRIAMEGGQNPNFTLDHEAVHAMRDLGLFKPSEWTALERAARADEDLMASVRQRYKGTGLDEEGIVEEAVADMFAHFRQDREGAGFIKAAFNRIRDFFAALRRLVTGAKSADDIMREIDSGEIGARTIEGVPGNFPDPRNMVAWHGTPHEFDDFSVDRIGTGEGAQAYGWGLYFAGNKAIAEHYRKTLSGKKNDYIDLARQALEANGIPSKMPDDYGNGSNATLRTYAQNIEHGNISLEDAAKKAGWADLDLRANPEGTKQALTDYLASLNKGRLYEVDLPEAHEMLDLDKPLGQQDPAIKDALAALKAHLEKVDELDTYEDNMGADFDEWTGLDLVKRILPRLGHDDAFPL
jgi:hypothetical protein